MSLSLIVCYLILCIFLPCIHVIHSLHFVMTGRQKNSRKYRPKQIQSTLLNLLTAKQWYTKNSPCKNHRILRLPVSCCRVHRRQSCSCFIRFQKAMQIRIKIARGSLHAHLHIGLSKAPLIRLFEPPALQYLDWFLSCLFCKDITLS